MNKHADKNHESLVEFLKQLSHLNSVEIMNKNLVRGNFYHILHLLTTRGKITKSHIMLLETIKLTSQNYINQPSTFTINQKYRTNATSIIFLAGLVRHEEAVSLSELLKTNEIITHLSVDGGKQQIHYHKFTICNNICFVNSISSEFAADEVIKPLIEALKVNRTITDLSLCSTS